MFKPFQLSEKEGMNYVNVVLDTLQKLRLSEADTEAVDNNTSDNSINIGLDTYPPYTHHAVCYRVKSLLD